MEKVVWCLNHLFPPKHFAPMNGVGNCKICIPDKDNVMCKGYKALIINIMEIKDKEN